jgi:hypothetical protein
MQSNTTLGQVYDLGMFNYSATATGSGVFSTVNWANPGASTALLSFKIDGQTKNGLSAGLALVTIGAPVSIAAAVPEPATLPMLITGLAAFAGTVRRKLIG